MSHPDVDHSHGLPFILDRFAVAAFYTNGMLPRGETGKRLGKALARKGLAPMALHAGDVVPLSEDRTVSVLHPADGYRDSKANERSLVLRLDHGERALALLPGDIERNGIRNILAGGADLAADVLVLPHHGSITSFDPLLYEAVSARTVLCSNGYLNRYGFPDPAVVQAVGGAVLTTAMQGQVVVCWPGRQQDVTILSGLSDLRLATGLFLR